MMKGFFGAPAVLIGSWLMLVGNTAVAQVPPGTGTDMELDPDATPPPEEKKPTELPPVQDGEWGVGGTGDGDGKFAPGGKTGALREQEEEKAEEAKVKGPLKLGPPGHFAVEMVYGFGDIRVVTNDANATKFSVASFVGSFRYRFGDTWAGGIRFPFSLGSSTGPLDNATDDYSTNGIGNLAVDIAPTFHLDRRLSFPVGVSLFLPLASGDLFASASDQGAVAQAILNQSAAAARGWEEISLFASKRFGFDVFAGADYDREALHLGVATKLEIMKKTGGNEPISQLEAANQGALQDPNTNWVTSLHGSYDFLDGLVTPELRTWVSVHTVPIRVGASKEYSGAQLVIEPRVKTEYPLDPEGKMAVTGVVGFILPVAGHIAGADGGSGAKGVRVQAGIAF